MNFFLIYGIGFFPELGVMGAGVSTMISSAIIALLLLRTISQHTSTGLTLRHSSKWTFERPVLHTMFHVGGSSLGEQFFERVWYVYIHYDCCFLRCGTFSSTLRMYEFNGYILLFCDGSWFAGASHTGKVWGHKRPDIARTYGKIGARIGLVVGLVSALIFIGPGDFLVQLYTRESDVVTLSATLMGIMAIAAFPQALQQVYSGVLKGAGDTYYIMKYSLVSVAIIRPIITYLLCITLGLGTFLGHGYLCASISL